MKKLMMMLCALLLLGGCAENPNPSGSGAVEMVPPSSNQQSTESVRYILEKEVLEDSIAAEDGTVLLTYRSELPKLATQYTGSEAENTTAAFNEAFDPWRNGDGRQEQITAAQEHYAFQQKEGMGWTNYTEEMTYTAYETERLVSVAMQSYSYTGGAHPNTAYLARNFDLERGTFFMADSLGAKGTGLIEAVTAEIVQQMEVRAKEADVPMDSFYWSNYSEIVAQWTGYAVSFDATGMAVTFSPYDLAPYAAGEQRFVLSYEFLKPYLSDEGKSLLGLSA